MRAFALIPRKAHVLARRMVDVSMIDALLCFSVGRAVRWDMVLMCRNTFNFFNSLVIFRHYFTGNGKVNCILATIFH